MNYWQLLKLMNVKWMQMHPDNNRASHVRGTDAMWQDASEYAAFARASHGSHARESPMRLPR